jgi:hypothetical protein
MGYELIEPQVKCIITMAAAETVTKQRFTMMVRSYDDEILINNVISMTGKSLVK